MTEILFARKTDVDTITAGALRFDVAQTLTAGQLTQLRSNAATGTVTAANDTNVTVTLGGTPTSAVWQSFSITLGWAGSLAVGRGGTGGTVASGTLLDNISGFASTGIMARIGLGSYAFRTVTGTTNRTTITNGDGVAGNPTVDIAATYVGQSSITTLGTITSGVWNGSLVTGTYGGTGVNNGANTITVGGNLNTANSFTTAGNFALTLTASAITNSTLPAGTHTLAGLDVAQTWSATQQFNDTNFALKGAISGTLTVKAAAVAGTNTLTFPAGTTDFSATGGTSQVVKQTSAGGAFTVGQLAASDLSNGTTGSGSVVLATSPTLVTPTLGVATATSINKVAITAPLTGATLTIADGKTLTANNSISFSGTDATTITFQGTDTYVGRATTDTLTNKTFDTAGAGNVFKINGTSITAVTGTGNVVLSASPTLTGTITAAAANFSGTITFGTGTITGLTNKASPDTTNDYVIIYDAAGLAVKKATVGSIASAGSVSSIGGLTGAVGVANGIEASGSNIQISAARRTLPTTQVFTTGSGTYTTPANCLWLEIFMIGGGGGGAGGGSGAGNGGNGSNTTFGATMIANGGSGAAANIGGSGGSYTLTGGGYAGITGGDGQTSDSAARTFSIDGGNGGVGALGGAGFSGPNANGGSAKANTGGGGGGAGANTVASPGGGGGAGGAVRAIINTPSATYAYAVGGGGSGGTAGTSGNAGGAGGSGVIWVIEHYGT